jgi:uncharacterized protein YaeQ
VAAGATVYTFTIDLSDADRGVYQAFELRAARHSSETHQFLLTRLLAYCLEWQDGIELTDGIAAVDQPAVIVRDLTGQIRAWIEVGAPDAARLHRGSKQAPRCAVYTHRDPAPLLEQLRAGKIHRAAELPVYSFDRAFIESASPTLTRRTKLGLSVTGAHLYLDIDGKGYESPVTEQRIG